MPEPAPDVIEGPSGLSPSGLALWEQCRYKWWGKYVLHVEDPAGPEAERGTRVHAVLEQLAKRPVGERTIPVAAALVKEVLADATTGERRDVWPHVVNAVRLTPLVDVDVIGTEQDLEADLGGVPFRGIADRVDRMPDGTIRVVDYKAGKVPDPRWMGDKVAQVTAYAAAWEATHGGTVSGGLLVFTVSGVLFPVPTPPRAQAVTIERLRAAWDGITSGIAAVNAGGPVAESFPASPGPLCSWCPMVGNCPTGLEATKDRAYVKGRDIGAHGQAALDAEIIGAMEATVAVAQRTHLRLVQP